MKLYEVPRNTYVKLQTGETVRFDHIDGMYSVCYHGGQICHLAANHTVNTHNHVA